MKYKCDKCGEVFDESDAGHESETEHLSDRGPAIQYFIVCPFCQCDELQEFADEAQEDEATDDG